MMAKPTIVIAILLIAVGLGGYFAAHPDASGHVSPTALIPAALGVVLGVLGAIALNDKARKHAMHFAAVVGLLGIIGDGMQLLKTLRNTTTESDVRQLKILSMGATLVLLVVFLALCIRSFAQARRNRQAAQ